MSGRIHCLMALCLLLTLGFVPSARGQGGVLCGYADTTSSVSQVPALFYPVKPGGPGTLRQSLADGESP